MLKTFSSAHQLASRAWKDRKVGVVRCTATADADVSSRPSSSTKPSSRSSLFGRGAPRVSSPRQGPSRQGEPAARPVRERERERERLDELYFLEDDDDQIQRRAVAVFDRCISKGQGVVVRSLGRQGNMGAMKFILALRAAGEAAPQQCDVRFRLLPQTSMGGFGTPLLMFVEVVKGRLELPAQGDDNLVKKFTISSRSDVAKLESSVLSALDGLKEGQSIRMEMVGVNNITRGLMALGEARGSMGRVGGSLAVVPHLVSEPLRRTAEGAAPAQAASSAAEQQQQQEQQQQPPSGDAAEPHTSSAGAATAAAAAAFPGMAAAATEAAAGPVLVDVFRLYVTLSTFRPERSTNAAVLSSAPQAESSEEATAAATSAPATAAVPETAAAPAAAPTAAPLAVGEGQIVVSLAEWESLRGAVGSMMEQQKLLAQMMAQQQQATGAAAGAATGAQPAEPQSSANFA